MATRYVFVGVASTSAQKLLHLIASVGVEHCHATYFNFNNPTSSGAIFRVPKKMASVVQNESGELSMQSRAFNDLTGATSFMNESLSM